MIIYACFLIYEQLTHPRTPTHPMTRAALTRCSELLAEVPLLLLILKGKGKVFNGQEPPSGESTTT